MAKEFFTQIWMQTILDFQWASIKSLNELNPQMKWNEKKSVQKMCTELKDKSCEYKIWVAVIGQNQKYRYAIMVAISYVIINIAVLALALLVLHIPTNSQFVFNSFKTCKWAHILICFFFSLYSNEIFFQFYNPIWFYHKIHYHISLQISVSSLITSIVISAGVCVFVNTYGWLNEYFDLSLFLVSRTFYFVCNYSRWVRRSWNRF